MTEMLKPQSGETVYDPTCGSAGMLISAIACLKSQEREWRNVRIYGQEINALTSAIARMNLFLHGVKDFQIVNDDTLIAPAFLENGRLQRFDLILANPPYSISQWNRDAFASDKYGRNFLGTPPQGRADYAFFQHILKSLDPKTGRCAILFPHGVLFRNEEAVLREKLIRFDLVECVIGLGANLFYNSPMEACIVICRTEKRPDRRGRILLINAVNEVSRKNAQSRLDDAHIRKIADAWEQYADTDGFARVITVADAEKNGWSLSIPLYVRGAAQKDAVDSRTVAECAAAWRDAAFDLKMAYAELKSLLEAGRDAG
jgi:type I restriction enzyme M protein